MKLLLDVNVVLDLLLDRKPWSDDAAVLWRVHTAGRVEACVAAFTLPTIYYIIRRNAGSDPAAKAVDACLQTLRVVATDLAALRLARSLPGGDFEDNLQIAAAMAVGADIIVTRDPKGFAASPIALESPSTAALRWASAAVPEGT